MGRERQYAWGSFSTAERVGTWIGIAFVAFMVFGFGYVVWWLVAN